MGDIKPCHSIVLDAAPLLLNDPSISTLLSKSENLFTVSAVVSEIKDPVARSRLETTVLPFLTIRNPAPTNIKVITDFARKTGDLAVLSQPDVQVLALAYELECERNRGDWRLRKEPGQKGLNGAPPVNPSSKTDKEASAAPSGNLISDYSSVPHEPAIVDLNAPEIVFVPSDAISKLDLCEALSDENPSDEGKVAQLETTHESESSESDSEGWITPSNLKKHQASDEKSSVKPESEPKVMQVATITSDFAMQNVLLQMNLNLLSPSLLRVRHLKTYILRCHGCFLKTKEMDKQFCPRCGKPTLTRVACTTDANGEFKLHLKKNMQWNTRGDRFSIPKPVGGTPNGKVGQLRGGGKGGWGQDLILAEDQKEYIQAITQQNRRKERNLMDEDYLPGILTGDRRENGGRPKVGGGRNVNSKKR